MKIYFLRHGEAQDKKPGMEDKDRPLTSKGAAAASNTARSLRGEITPIDAILSSPLLRATQTAGIFANALGPEKGITVTESLLVGSDPAGLMSELRSLEGVDSVLIAGHQPHIGICVSYLTGMSEDELMVKKGSCLLVEADEPAKGRGRLVWTKDPAAL